MPETMTNALIVIILLIALVAYREYLAFQERREMLDRLMAKSLPEYKSETAPVKTDEPTLEDLGLEEIDDAKEALMEDDPDADR